MGRAIIALGILLAWARGAYALDPALDVSQYAHTAWKVRDGFAKSGITAIAQTSDGYLWLGTEFGLLRFDGVRAVPWQPPAGEQLPSASITHLMVSRDGTLWIGTQKGLVNWRNGKLTRFVEFGGHSIASLLEDREGTVWVGEWQQPLGRLCAIRDGTVECYGTDGSLGWGALSLYEDTRGSLWVGSSGGFWHWKPGAPKFYVLANTAVPSFAEDTDGALLIAAQGMGIRRVIDGRIEQYKLPNSVRGLAAYRMLIDRDGTLWIGIYSGGLVHVHQGRTDTFKQADGLSGNAMSTLFEDQEGNIWVATTDGLDHFRNFAIPRWSGRQGVPFAPGAAVLAARDGSVWTGGAKALGRLNQTQVLVYRQRPEPGASLANEAVRETIDRALPENFFALLQDHGGRIWVSSPKGGLGYLEAQRYHRINSVGTRIGIAMAEDPSGDLWVDGQEDGLFRLHDEKIVEKVPWDMLGRKDFGSRLTVDRSQGGLWIGYLSGGVIFLKDGQLRASYSASDGLGEGVVNDLRFGSRGTLWAATEGGLSRIRDRHITTLTSKNGLPCDTVHWTMEDDEHFVWLYMSCGLVHIARSELDNWANDTKHKVQATLLDASDGVRTEANPTGHSPQVSKAPDGRIYFVTLDGVSVIDPRHLPFNKLPPPVHVEQITADRKTYWQNLSGDASSSPPKLPPLMRDLTIDYTALSLVVPEKVRFRVKLEGQDKDWRELTDRRVNYTNLAPKHYRFMVKACNNSGVWNEEGAALDFVIPPAWYQTDWFRALCVAAFLALLWALYQYRLHRLARQFQMTLDTRVAERTRIARDLHDTLLQSFHGVLLYFQTGINQLPEHASEARTAEARKTLEKAMHQAKHAIVEGREAIQGLRSSVVETNDLALAMRTLGEELSANANSVAFQVHVEGASRDLHPILRDEVYRITGEGIRNAFHHADAKQIEVEIHYDDRRLRVRVRDDGKGIDPKLLGDDGREGHFGLRGMRERAKLLGGKLTVWSELDAGTELELSIPAARAYTDGQQISLTEKLLAKLSGRGTMKKP